VGFLSSDIQPWFMVFTLLGLMMGMKIHLSYLDKIFVVTNLVLVLFYSVIFYSFVDVKSIMTWMLFALMPLVISIFRDLDKQQFLKRISVVTLILLFVGLVQVFNRDFASFMIARDIRLDIIESSGRGVRSLTSEPSVFSRNIAKLALMISILVGFRPLKQFILYVMNVALSLSVYGVITHTLILVVSSGKRMITSTIFLIFLFNLVWDNIPGRAGYILDGIKDNPELLLEQGAFARVVNIPISLKNTMAYWPEGSVVKILPRSAESINTPIGVYNYDRATRNLGGIIELPYRFGFLGLLSLIVFLLYFFIKTSVFKTSILKVLVLFFFIQDGSIIDPCNWALFGILYSFKAPGGGFKIKGQSLSRDIH
jgi:hypothetical protein